MTHLAALLIPALRWDPTHGFTHLHDTIDDALELGVGGFLIRGGPRDAVSALTRELHARAPIPLLLAADVERGAGQQFEGCIGLPPLGALGALNDPDSARRSARITARELKHLGLNWALAPVCDLDLDPGSPIVGTRAAGSDPSRIGALLEEWIDACQAEGVLACAKHFPGHGRAVEDSHRALPVVRARAGQLMHEDLAPFRAALDVGVASVMTAHVAYPSLDPSGAPATLSAPVLHELLRKEMEFDGLIASDALEMNGLLAAGPEPEVAIRAVAAGCDVLLAPMDILGVARALERASQNGVLVAERARDALERRDRWAFWARSAPGREPTIDDVMWARQLADRTVSLVRGAMPRLGEAAEIVEVDDDAGGAWAVPSRAHFAEAFRALDLDAPVVSEPTSNTRVPVLIAAYSDVVAWKGTAGFSDASRARIEHTIAAADAKHRETLVVLFSHPRAASQIPNARNILCAWGGEPPMQMAAARVIVRGTV
ncbi:MAG: glycoside hydrolase family 3 N-terminal domain-containing protein [Gemmatimonadales bacterium]